MSAKVMAIQLLLLRIWKEGCLDFIQLIENQIFWACPIRRGVGMGRAIRFNLFCGGRQKRISAPIPQAFVKNACLLISGGSIGNYLLSKMNLPVIPVSHPEGVTHRNNGCHTL